MGPCEVRSSSRPETQGYGGCRRRSRPGAFGVPHPGAGSPASSPTLFCRCCPARLNPHLCPQGMGEGESGLLLVPRGFLRLLARGSSKCGNHRPAETAEVCFWLLSPSPSVGFNETPALLARTVLDWAQPRVPGGSCVLFLCLLRLLKNCDF